MREITCLTFDCYGTIIDWDGGIRAAAAAVGSLEGCDLERFLRDREQADAELNEGDYLPYDEVLRQSLRRAAAAQGRSVTEEEAAGFAHSMGSWPPFADSVRALRWLGSRYRLAILSNVITSVLERSVAQLADSEGGIQFDALVTAEQLESYKPARAHFDAGLARLEVESDRVLHVAGSLYHDIRPALGLGWRCAWVDRRGDGLPADIAPAFVVGSLGELVERLGG